MRTSTEDAHRLLNKWMSESSPLSVMISGEGIGGMFFGNLTHVSSSELILTGGMRGLAIGNIRVLLEGATFEYSDARAPVVSISNVLVGSRAASLLEISLPSGTKCLITEIDLHPRMDSTTTE